MISDEISYSRGQKDGQEAGSQKDRCTHRFWDVLTDFFLRHPESHGESPMAFLFVGEAEGKKSRKNSNRKYFLKKFGSLMQKRKFFLVDTDDRKNSLSA
jgi:hypothetical protein